MIKRFLTKLLVVALCLLPSQSRAYWQSVTQQSVGSTAPLDGTTPTGAWSASRAMLTTWVGAFYTDTAGAVDAFLDQSGNTRNFTAALTGRPTIANVGSNSRPAISCNGTANRMDATALNTFITASSGYAVVTFIPREVTNQANVFDNMQGFTDDDAYIGVFIKNNELQAFNYDGTSDVPTAVTTSINNVYTVSWRHEGGTLFQIVNGGTENSISSGNTSLLTTLLRICGGRTTGFEFSLVDVLELAIYTTVPSSGTRSAIEANMKNWGGS